MNKRNKITKTYLKKYISKSICITMSVIMTLSLLYCDGMSFFDLKVYASQNEIDKTISENKVDDLYYDDNMENNAEIKDVDEDDNVIDIVCDEETEALLGSEDLSSPHKSEGGYISYDIIEFGEYQGEKIRWMVLDSNDNNVFLLSEKIIECSKEKLTVNWGKSPIRQWLNNDFYQEAFNKDERSAIKETINGNGYSNPIYSYISGGGDTSDRIFLLSYDEVTNPKYGFSEYSFVTDDMRRAHVTEYAANNGAFISSDEPYPDYGYWWLRTPGKTKERLSCITSTGVLYAAGYNLDQYDGGIRPAMWVEKDRLEKLEVEKTDDLSNVDLSIKSTQNVYNGKVQPLISAVGLDPSIVYEFSLDGEKYSCDIPGAVNAGEYTVYCKVTFPDKSIIKQTVVAEIAKRSLVASNTCLKQSVFDFDEDKGIVEPEFVFEDYPEDACRNIICEDDYTIYGTTSGIKEGKYSITIEANEDGNYYGRKNIDWYIVRDTILIQGQKKNITEFFLHNENKDKVISKYVVKEGTKYATVSKKGVIKPKKTGKIKIEAYENIEGEARLISACSFEIIRPSFNQEMMQARYDGWSVDLSKALEIPNTQKVTFKANKKKVATIDSETGVLNVHTDKSTKVTVTASYMNEDGNKVDISGKFIIKIPKMSEDTLNIKNGNSEKLGIKEIVNDELQKEFWYSSNPDVAVYNEETGLVESYSSGSTTITCMIEGKSYVCNVVVN